MPIESDLCEAIKSRTIVEIYYDPGARFVEPYCLGFSRQNEPLLRAYQIKGASESGEHVNWKLLRLDRVRWIKLTNDNFKPERPEYNPEDKAMKGGIIARV